MRIYLDSSAIVKRVIDEPESDALEDALETHAARGDWLVTSALARVEVSRALRTRIDAEDPQTLDRLGQEAFMGIAEYPLDGQVLALARRIGPPVLRSLDALHLASAVLVDADAIVVYDARLATAAREMGLTAHAWR